jgi:hypothetical protein
VSLVSADLVSLLGLCEDVVLVLVSLLELGEDVVLVLVSLLELGEDVVWVLVSLLDLGEVEKDLVGLASLYYHPVVEEV